MEFLFIFSSSNNNSGIGSHRDRSTRHSHRSSRRNKHPDMAPFQTSVNIGDDGGNELIEVQILPQDQTWGENTTVVTGNTSDQSISMEDISTWPIGSDSGIGFTCHRYMERIFCFVLCIIAFVSPVTMVIMPKIGFFSSTFDNQDLTPLVRVQLLACNAECKGLLVSLAARMLLLALGLWALYFRNPVATMPRIYLFKSIILLLVLISTFAYWLFYIVQITEGTKAIVEGSEIVNYKTVVSYAIAFADTLLFIHYIGVVLLEIKQLQPNYYIKVIRSPDGESKSFSIGQLSIQRAAVYVLQKYYVDFPIYNPYLERIPVSKSQRKAALSNFKYYEVDGINNSQEQSQSRAVLAANARRRDSSHNERFYEEHEYDRRVKKRRARLVTAAEEAFTHIKRVQNEPTNNILDPHEASQAIFPSMARALQKYLRITRQQPRHTVESILKHLAYCLKNDLSPKAFLEPYLIEFPVLQSEKERDRNIQCWSLICEELLSRPISNGCTFQLIQNDVSLNVYVYRLPHLNISEEVVDPKCNKFVLKLNSETSV